MENWTVSWMSLENGNKFKKKVTIDCNPYRHIQSVREKENGKHEGIR